jgi:hypothetical protein
MPYDINNREYVTDQITLATQASATVKLTTSLTATAKGVGQYIEMAVCCKVTANDTAAPGLYLQVSNDGGTTWFNRITLDADMTTTANNTYVAVTNFGDTVRVMCVPGTSSSIVAYTVYAVAKR